MQPLLVDPDVLDGVLVPREETGSIGVAPTAVAAQLPADTTATVPPGGVPGRTRDKLSIGLAPISVASTQVLEVAPRIAEPPVGGATTTRLEGAPGGATTLRLEGAPGGATTLRLEGAPGGATTLRLEGAPGGATTQVLEEVPPVAEVPTEVTGEVPTPAGGATTQVFEEVPPVVAGLPPAVEPPVAEPALGPARAGVEPAAPSLARAEQRHDGRLRWALVAASLILSLGVVAALALRGDEAADPDEAVAEARAESPMHVPSPTDARETAAAPPAKAPPSREEVPPPAEAPPLRAEAPPSAEAPTGSVPASPRQSSDPSESKDGANGSDLDLTTPHLFPTKFVLESKWPQQTDWAEVDRLVTALAACPGRIAVVGHTCSLGSPDFNLRLGESRAQEVAAMLRKRGLEHPRIELRSVGDSDPIESNDTSTGRVANRRVTVECRPSSDTP